MGTLPRGGINPHLTLRWISQTLRHFAINIEYHLLDFSSINGPNYLSITSITSWSRLIDSSGSFIHHTSTCSTTQTWPSKQKGSSMSSTSSTICQTLAASADPTTSPSPQPSTSTSRSKRKGSSGPFIYLTSTCSTTSTSTSRQRGSSGPFIHSTSASSRASTGKLHQEIISRL